MRRSGVLLGMTLALCAACSEAEQPAAQLGQLSQQCDQVPAAGCCLGAAVLVHCSSSGLQATICPGGELCGWNSAFGLYSCGPSGAADPSGQAPRSCASDAALAFDLGAADAAAGADAAAATDATTDATATADASACGPLTYEGCCAGGKLHYCIGGSVMTLDCAAAPACGWNATSGVYDCGTSGDSDPAGVYPQQCSAVLADAAVNLDGGGGLDGGAGDLSSPPDLASASPDLERADLAPSLDRGALDSASPPGADGPGLDGAPGLDASGLDAGEPDSGRIKATGGGGCDGCHLVPSHRSEAGGALTLLALFLLLLVPGRSR